MRKEAPALFAQARYVNGFVTNGLLHTGQLSVLGQEA